MHGYLYVLYYSCMCVTLRTVPSTSACKTHRRKNLAMYDFVYYYDYYHAPTSLHIHVFEHLFFTSYD